MKSSLTFFRSLPNSYIIVGHDLSILDATDTFLSEAKIEREQLSSLNVLELSSQDPDDLRQVLQAVLLTGKPKNKSHPYITATGEVGGVIHEVDKIERREVRPRATLHERVTDGFLCVTKDLKIADVNSFTLSVLKKTREELIGFSLKKVLPLKGLEPFVSRYKDAFKSGRAAFFEETYDGRIYSVEAYPRKDGKLSIFYRDITALKKAEKDLKDALEMRNEFLSVASHELKTPLTALKLQVQMAKRDMDRDGIGSISGAKIQQVIERTNNEVLRLSRLVDDMLDVSRLSNGKFSLSFDYFYLEDFMDDFIRRFSTGYLNFEEIVRVSVKVPVLVQWDKLRVEQVLSNLLTNAFRYGNGATIDLTATAGGGNVYIVVSDQGPGIPKEKQERIFDRFERATKCGGGLGLGLYICKEIVEAHGGRIALSSLPGKGASFQIQIPIQCKN